jgi:AraC-like DNA-binding protein
MQLSSSKKSSDVTASVVRPLQRHVLFTSSAIDETQRAVSSVFCRHTLSARKQTQSTLDARMHHAAVTPQSSLNFLEYGSEVTVEPGLLGDFFNIQVQLTGAVETRCGTETAVIAQGEAAVLSPRKYVSMNWERDSSMLIYSIKRALVERKLETLLDRHLTDPIVFNTIMRNDKASNVGWLRGLQVLVTELDSTHTFLNCMQAMRSYEDSLVMSLLHNQPHNYMTELGHRAPSVAPGHVKRAEQYIHAHADQAISIEELARAAHTSVRSLFAGFKQYRGISPMKYLRDVRLDQARHELLKRAPGVGVTEVAHRRGFMQLGRFAAAYQQRFGELPSETLRGEHAVSINTK